MFFCRYGAVAWVFITCLFVANTAFNNLGFPLLAMVFNWGRATLGTIPFVTLGASCGGVEGAMLGIAAGAAIFGLIGAAIGLRRDRASRKAPSKAEVSIHAARMGGAGRRSMNLNDIIQAAQGGQGVNNLASQFGLSPEQTQAAIQAMMPAFSTGLQNAMQDPAGPRRRSLASRQRRASRAPSPIPIQAQRGHRAGGGAWARSSARRRSSSQISQQAAQISGVNAADHSADDADRRLDADRRPGAFAERAGPRRHARARFASAVAAPGGWRRPSGRARLRRRRRLLGGLVGMLGGLLGGGQPAGDAQSARRCRRASTR